MGRCPTFYIVNNLLQRITFKTCGRYWLYLASWVMCTILKLAQFSKKKVSSILSLVLLLVLLLLLVGTAKELREALNSHPPSRHNYGISIFRVWCILFYVCDLMPNASISNWEWSAYTFSPTPRPLLLSYSCMIFQMTNPQSPIPVPPPCGALFKTTMIEWWLHNKYHNNMYA